MGSEATKSRLDSQLDAFLGRVSSSTHVTATPVSVVKIDPISDPSGISIDCLNNYHLLSLSISFIHGVCCCTDGICVFIDYVYCCTDVAMG